MTCGSGLPAAHVRWLLGVMKTTLAGAVAKASKLARNASTLKAGAHGARSVMPPSTMTTSESTEPGHGLLRPSVPPRSWSVFAPSTARFWKTMAPLP